jgi:RNA recognition motif-containing protein
MTKLFVGNLSYKMDDAGLQNLFAKYGNILSATVIIDKTNGRSKGFGFVEIEDDEMAKQAISELNGTAVDGRNITLSVARPMVERSPRDRR